MGINQNNQNIQFTRAQSSIVQQAELYKLRTVLRTLEYPLGIDNTARHQWNQERSTTPPTPNDPDKLCMSRMAATYQTQNLNLNERKLEGPGEEVIEKLQILVQQIEAQVRFQLVANT